METLSDNIMVARRKWGAEFLSIYLCYSKNYTEAQEHRRNLKPVVSITRYCVPGRIATYDFEYVEGGSGHGDRVQYFSESMGGPMTMARALLLLRQDLQKPQVLRLFQEFVKEARSKGAQPELTTLNSLVKSLAPSTRTGRFMAKVELERQTCMRERMAAWRKKERQRAPAGGMERT